VRRLVALPFLLAACVPTNAARAPSSSFRPSETTMPAASATALPTATVAASPTAAPALLGSIQGDFDCDSKGDELRLYEVARRPGTPIPAPEPDKLARLLLATGATHEMRFEGVPQADGGGNPLLGTADINGDGCVDAILTVGRGASTVWTAFLVFDGARLREVDEAGKPAIFLFDGSVRHGDAIECRKTKDTAEIVARAISNYTSEYQWDLVERVYRWSGKTTLALFATNRSAIPVPTADAEPPEPGRYWGLSCGSVRFPGWAFTR
jgi:hypothetical protein